MQDDDNLRPVNAESLGAFEAAESEIVTLTVKRGLKKANFPAEQKEEMSRKFTAGLFMTTKILHSIMTVGKKELLQDQIDWADRRLPYEGITPEIMRRNLLLLKESLEMVLGPVHSAGIIPYIDFLIR